jgi:hypothetical protein
MLVCDTSIVLDPILAAGRLPRLSERAMRDAIVQALEAGRFTPRRLIDRALLRFERAAARLASGAARPCMLFAERDRIVRELRAFVDGRLAARINALPRSAFVAIGARAAPFDAIVRNRRGRTYGVLFRRLPGDSGRLDVLRRVREALGSVRTPMSGVLVYDFARARATLVSDQAGANGVYGHLRAS